MAVSQIRNHLTALNEGKIPATLSKDRTTIKFNEVKIAGVHGTRHWTIEVMLMKDNKPAAIEDGHLEAKAMDPKYTAQILTQFWQEGGIKTTSAPTIVAKGKNIGRSNETNVLGQAINDALSEYRKKNKRSTESEISDLYPPMLIKWLNKTKDAVLTEDDFREGIIVQRKYDGLRSVARLSKPEPASSGTAAAERKVEMYSRDRKYISIDIEMETELKSMLIAGIHLDGELYVHGKTLNYISGQVRRSVSARDIKLEYHIFDCFNPNKINASALARQKQLDKLFKGREFKTLFRVENYEVKTSEEINKLHDKFIAEGYEGAVIRKMKKPYCLSYTNKHTANVLKKKPVHDSEFDCLDFTTSDKGKSKGSVIWICATKEGARFNVVPKDMSLEKSYKIYRCLTDDRSLFDKYIKGKQLTVMYNEISSGTGIPLQAKALRFATQDNDPIEEVLKKCR